MKIHDTNNNINSEKNKEIYTFLVNLNTFKSIGGNLDPTF